MLKDAYMMSGIEMAMMPERQPFYFWLPLVSFWLAFAKIPTPPPHSSHFWVTFQTTFGWSMSIKVDQKWHEKWPKSATVSNPNVRTGSGALGILLLNTNSNFTLPHHSWRTPCPFLLFPGVLVQSWLVLVHSLSIPTPFLVHSHCSLYIPTLRN